MNSGCLFFDSSCQQGNMLFIGNGDPLFRGVKSGRRPFFSSPEELYDDDEQLPEKKRRLTPEQVHMLEKSFEEENKLEPERKSELAKKLGLQQRQVAVWFQNRRARWKTKQLERDFDNLKSSYDSLLSDYDSILKDNEKLKAELVSLTEKLRTKEVAGAPRPDPVAADLPGDSAGSSGSTVVDDDGRQLVNRCDSYFLVDDYAGCARPPADGIQSEEDDGSEDGRNHVSDDFVAAVAVAEQLHLEEREALSGWWVWS